MKSLETLLKVAKRRLDDLGLEISRMQQRADGLRMEEAALLAREQVELAAASQDITLIGFMPAYRQRVALQVGRLRVQKAEVEASIETVRGKLKAAYQEKSKFEELIERDRKRIEVARASAEQAALDEAAINRVGRG